MVKDIKDLSHLAWIPSRNEPHLQLPVNKGWRIADHIIKIPVLHRILLQIQETDHSGQHGSCQWTTHRGTATHPWSNTLEKVLRGLEKPQKDADKTLPHIFKERFERIVLSKTWHLISAWKLDSLLERHESNGREHLEYEPFLAKFGMA